MEWQDISTAPRDILVLVTDGDALVTGMLKVRDHDYSDVWRWQLDRPLAPEWLTHWMPLPEPPVTP